MEETIRETLVGMVYEIVPDKRDVPIQAQTDLLEDLSLDSMCLFELVDRIEETWGVQILDMENFIGLFRNFGELCRVICEQRN